jgi:thiol:disulfide interchange protein DsbC
MALSLPSLSLAALAALLMLGGHAGNAQAQQEAAIRKALTERLPQLPKIDEITRSPVPGLWQVRYGGTELLYSDDKGEHVFVNGSLVETKTRTDLTEAALDRVLAVSWDKLPLKDAMVMKQGTGARKLAIFEDPNCGYCKRLERDLASLKDVTIYTFLIPILGPDSVTKSRDIWCAKDNARVWRTWMIDGAAPPKNIGTCDTTAMDRNLAFAKAFRVNGTPAVFFEDGARKPGAIPLDQIEKMLVAASKKVATAQ